MSNKATSYLYHGFISFKLLISLILGIMITMAPIIRAEVKETGEQNEQDILNSLLNNGHYGRNVRTANANSTGPTVVVLSLDVDRIRSLDDTLMELEISFTLRQKWTDERYRFNQLNSKVSHVDPPSPELNRLWIPDMFLKNEISSTLLSTTIGPNVNARIFSDGTVLHTSRITGTFYCPMDLTRFPIDTQMCPISITSHSHPQSEVQFEWSGINPIKLTGETLHLSKFKLSSVGTGNCTSDERSCIQAEFTFKRALKQFIFNFYIPLVIMVIISYLSFWIHPVQMATPRVLICLATIILAIVKISIFKSYLAPEGYDSVVVDVWTSIIIAFLALALLEFVLIAHICKSQTHPEEPTKVDTVLSTDSEAIYEELPTVLKPFNKYDRRNNNEEKEEGIDFIYNRRALLIDRVVRLLFPVAFFGTVILYWFVYFDAAYDYDKTETG